MAQPDRVKNFLKGAKRARLNGRFKFNDFIGDGDDDDIYKVRIRSSSELNLKLKRLRDDANVEIYAFDKPKAKVLRKIGQTPFSDIPRRKVNKFLNRVARSNNRGRSNEKIVTDLERGLYYVRVTPRQANRNSTRYRLIMKSKDLPPVVDPLDPTTPGTDPGTGGGTDPGTGGGTNPGTGGGTDPGTGGGTDPGTGGGTDPGTGGGTDPGTDPGTDGNDTALVAQPLKVDFKERTYSNNNLPNGFAADTFSLGASDAEDWFKFDLASNSVFNLELTGLSATELGTNLDVEIRSANGESLTPALGSFELGTAAESIVEASLDTGSYLIRVNRVGGGESDYALTLSAMPADVDPNNAGNDFDNARVLTLDGDLADSGFDNRVDLLDDFVGGTDSNDYYKVTIPAGGGFISVSIDEIEDNDVDGIPSNINLQIIPGAAIENGVIVNPDLVITSSRGSNVAEELAGSFDEGDYFIRVYPASEDDAAFYKISVAAFSTLDIPALTRDINVGIAPSLTGSTLIGDTGSGTGILYFAANDGSGEALWKSGGTFATTTKIGAASNIANLTNVNGTIYFTSNGGGSGTELWNYDGNTISQVLDIAPGTSPGISDPKFTIVSETNLLFFVANNGVNGAELWATDGANTKLVADINIGDAGSNSNPSSLTVVGDMLYFRARDNNRDDRLYRIDTSTLDLSTNLNPETSYETITAAALSSDADPGNLKVANGKLYFTADEEAATSIESLWVINDPTAATANATRIVNPTAFGLAINDNPEYGEFVEYDGTLFFVATDAADASGIWKVNAAGNGVEQVAALGITATGGTAKLNPEQLTVVGDKLYFVGNTVGTTDLELWISDGSQQLNLNNAVGSYEKTTGLNNFDNLTVVGTTTPQLYFTANDGTNGIELWTSDGDVASTELVADIRPGTASSSPENLVVVGNRLFFKANDGQVGQELWVLGVEA
ncbi:MAG: ELWxxDGT repeat protein [Elainellaceae cyanobacterium]